MFAALFVAANVRNFYTVLAHGVLLGKLVSVIGSI